MAGHGKPGTEFLAGAPFGSALRAEIAMNEPDHLSARLKTGTISRREFLGRATALGASMAAISSTLTSVEAFAAETPKAGGALRLGMIGGSTTDSLDIG